jgi:succinate dehydrogenase / fumarate reductase cytochrome b subunit
MNIITHIFKSSLGRKYLMALTGLVMGLFVCGHLAGNLQIFLPPEAINRYARFLQSNVELLWPVRLVMLGSLVLHIWAAASLTRDNLAARPEGYYNNPAPIAATFASRTMVYSGLIAGAFVIYHLLHYTVVLDAVSGSKVPLTALKARHDVYAMMIAGFQVWYVSLFYLVGVGLLCLHLSHGFQAMFASLGWKNHVYGPALNCGAKALAVALFLGYAAIPVSVMCGLGDGYLKQAVVQAAAGMPAATEAK